MERIIGKLIWYLRKASPDGFYYDTKFHKGCGTHIIHLPKLNQIIVIKFPTREHYISHDLAYKYLESNRLILQDKFGKSVYQDTWILNILISDRLTKSCYDLVTSGNYENMDMLFNPKKTRDKEILNTILRALATKFRSWSCEIKKSCSKTYSEYRKTSKGTIRLNKKIEPYGIVKEKIRDLDRAADILEVASSGYNKRKSNAKKILILKQH